MAEKLTFQWQKKSSVTILGVASGKPRSNDLARRTGAGAGSHGKTPANIDTAATCLYALNASLTFFTFYLFYASEADGASASCLSFFCYHFI